MPEELPEKSYDADVLSTSRVEELLSHLRRLPEQYRVVFNLHALEGYSHAEIAQLIGIEESTSRSHLTRSRKILQNLVEKEEEYFKITSTSIA